MKTLKKFFFSKKGGVIFCMFLVTVESWILDDDGLGVTELIEDKWYEFPADMAITITLITTLMVCFAVFKAIVDSLPDVEDKK